MACVAIAVAGCGLGPGEASEGEATLTVTHDYGREPMIEATEQDPPSSETVIRLLDSEAELTTRYGGAFVQSIDGVAGEFRDGRRFDWVFFLNGVWSSEGAAAVEVRGGDRVWWDYRDWTAAMRIPAVVGSWPEPFAQAAAGAERLPVRIECAGAGAACAAVAERLADEGVEARVAPVKSRGAVGGQREAIRLLVGRWSRVGVDPAAAQLEGGPQVSGVFARFERIAGEPRLLLFDERAEAATRLRDGAGLVAAVRDGDAPPTWLVTGTDSAGVKAAAAMLDEDALDHRYAVASDGEAALALPLAAE